MGICSAKARQPVQRQSEIKRFSKENIRLYYKIGKVLGSGSFGTVKIGYGLHDQKPFAIKTIHKYKLQDKFYLVQRELDILTQLDHPNIIKVFEEYEDEMYYHFVMEFSSGGELLERIVKKGYIQESEAKVIMKQLFSAIQYVHEQGIVHRDLKPENILFASPDPDSQIKIIDFGLSKKFRDYSQKLHRMNSRVGTPVYVAPEVFQGNYSYQCDEWSLGCIMHVLLCGEPPFYAKDMGMLQVKIINAKVDFQQPQFQDISSDAKHLISQLLQKSPKKRITSLQALQHAWFTSAPAKIVTQKQISDGEHQKIIKMLKTYANTTKLKKETLKILLNYLNNKQILQLQEVFQDYDKDSNGVISVSEIQQLMTKLKLKQSQEQIVQLMEKISNKKGEEVYIQYSEFLSALVNNKEFLNRERLWSLFRYFDVEGKHYITLEDMRRAFAREGRDLSEVKLLNLFQDANVDEQGQIPFEKFCEMMHDDGESILEESEEKLAAQHHNQ